MGEAVRIEHQHHDLRAAVTELEGMLAPPRAGAAALVARLDRFLAELHEHFAYEERGTLFADIAAMRPNFDREVARLMRQHADIQAGFADARRAAAAGRPADRPLREAINTLLEHERAEMDLVQEASLTDLGGG